MTEPPGSFAALADHIGFTYHFCAAAKGLSTRGPGIPEELVLEELELLEELLLDELLDVLLPIPEELDDELLEELELLEEEELLDEEELVLPLPQLLTTPPLPPFCDSQV